MGTSKSGSGGDRYKPGQSAPYSGQYERLGSRGGSTGEEVTGVRGKTLPPTPLPKQTYRLVDPSNNGSGKKR
ncbi:hypothetical protein ELG79_36580 [Rhizobium leguminosarum]|uniref:hypothetical protein n=1 Tax=Rhizobium leguminosarum TaxID=384 RepID=UPI0010307FD6|nr:hypothetical protein [Rhizobium leguminosarum]TBG08440.1 hypothetical protein ELG79_36580 [Rhizobium leguminosarum]